MDNSNDSLQLLTEHERDELRILLLSDLRSNMFGDGLEEMYLTEGFPLFPGVDNMSDAELLEELGHYDPEVDDTPEKRAAAWKRELAEGEESE